MAEKGFGVKEINLIGASGTPTIESPNNLNLNAVNVAISTNATIGGNLTVTGTVGIAGTLTYEDVTNVDAIGIVTAREGVFLPDDKKLELGNAAGSGDIAIYHNGSDAYIDNDTGGLRINTASDEVQINKATNEYMARFITDGNVELYSNNVKRFQTRSGGSAADGIAVFGNSSNSSINLFTDTTIRGTVYANSSNAIGFLDEGGDWAIKHTNNTSTEFYVSTQLRAMIDSDGLKFNGDTATANALDDYEEGTFTPTISDGSGNNSTFGSVTAATYTKIGNTVRASFRAVNVQTSGLTGSDVFYVKGLPFTTTGRNYNLAFIRSWNASNWSAAQSVVAAFVESDQVSFYGDDGSTTGGVVLKVEDMINNQTDIFMTMLYQTTE